MIKVNLGYLEINEFIIWTSILISNHYVHIIDIKTKRPREQLQPNYIKSIACYQKIVKLPTVELTTKTCQEQEGAAQNCPKTARNCPELSVLSRSVLSCPELPRASKNSDNLTVYFFKHDTLTFLKIWPALI